MCEFCEIWFCLMLGSLDYWTDCDCEMSFCQSTCDYQLLDGKFQFQTRNPNSDIKNCNENLDIEKWRRLENMLNIWRKTKKHFSGRVAKKASNQRGRIKIYVSSIRINVEAKFKQGRHSHVVRALVSCLNQLNPPLDQYCLHLVIGAFR